MSIPHRSRRPSRGAAAALAALALASCAPHKRPPPMGPAVVQVVTIRTQPVTLTSELPARTNALEVADVRPQVNGIIKERLFTQGAIVHAGQELYQIDPAPYQAAYDQAKAQLASARAGVVTARYKAERYAELAKIKAVSQQDADDAQAAYLQDAAAVLQQEAALESARINLGYTRIIAPITGRIGPSAITRGALAVNGQTNALSTIQRLDPIYVDLTQSATDHLKLAEDLARIGPAGGPPRGAVVRAQLVDGRPYPLEGRLLFSDVTVDQSTGSVTLRARFPNPNSVLLPGMYVRATVVEGVDPKGILLTQAAVGRDEKGRPTALIVDSSGKAQLRMLELGGAIGPNWRVISGLSPGDRVIVSGSQDAKPGAPVRIAATVPGPG